MKICIGYKISKGPWGGGNRFVTHLISNLQNNGHEVVYELNDKDIDLILFLDPRWRHKNTTFNSGSILRYLIFKNMKTIVVHRINECDERKNSKNMNYKLRLANYCADHTVLVGSWMKSLKLTYALDDKYLSVIRNGADSRIFNNKGHIPWNKKEPLKLVTHHWSSHFMKGFDIYMHIDKMLNQVKWKNIIEFTYIGNLPNGFDFKNVRHVKPLNGLALAEELKKHDAYLTASINEPGGNHQNEGALCGLPLIYRESGCFPEYCKDFGMSFVKYDIEDVIIKFMENYEAFYKKISYYPNKAEITSAKYERLFRDLFSRRKIISEKRNLFRSPWHLLRNQLPL